MTIACRPGWTRPRPHVDRLASAWLVTRFIDPDAEFVFAAPEDFLPDAVPFDAPGADFSHHGEDCSFETLIKRFGLRDRRLRELAEIVHDMDLRDDRFGRDEARGLDLALRGLLATFKDDHQVLAQGMILFDGLYATGVRAWECVRAVAWPPHPFRGGGSGGGPHRSSVGPPAIM